jgi:glycosyltransferase involved in cell wall biosynthesis
VDSKKINIALIVTSDLQSGGGFQYESMIIKMINKYYFDDEFKFKIYTFDNSIYHRYNNNEIDISLISENIFQKVHRLCLSSYFLFNFFSKINLKTSFFESILKNDKIDLVYFLSPSIIAQGLNNIPYIFTLWDLGHLDLIEFPEVSHNRQFELREQIYYKSLRKAFKIIVDLDYGKKRVIEKYNVDVNRVEVFKFIPNLKLKCKDNFIDIKKKYNLKNNYIFYPAQFWAHKNHIYILNALKILRDERNIEIDVIFSGSDKGNLNYILDKAKELKIDDLVYYIGFADEKEIPFLYEQSIALVMPTFLGPTNIPPLEAFAYETTVCYSDTPFFREQVGDAAFFMDLKNPNSLVDHIITINTDQKLVDLKKGMGLKIIKSWTDEDFYIKILNLFKEFKYKRNLWN